MIRKATLADKDAIATIWRKDGALLGGLYMGALKERIEKGMVHVFTAQEELLGFVEFRLRRDGVTVVYHIAVKEDWRGFGIGLALMDSLSLPIRLKVTSDNPQAIHFYESYCMTRVAEDKARTDRELYVYERAV
jgi:ribosomal protein S18 acetylase RimI-like enzyme